MLSTKRLGLLLAALLTATMTFGVVTSGAWFTDSDSVAVTATSGEIDIQANPVSFSVDNLLPGVWSPREEITIYNTANSTVAVKYRLTDLFGTQSVGGFYDQIQVRVIHKFCGGIDHSTVYEGALNALEVTSATSISPAGLGVNITHCYIVQFALPTTAGNAFQDQDATFDLVFDATQPENPGWSQ
jgi:hypothetical protein